MISHGIAGFLKERMYESSDAFRLHVCDQCGLMAVANLKKQEFHCSVCRNSTQISQIYIPYAAKVSSHTIRLGASWSWHRDWGGIMVRDGVT